MYYARHQYSYRRNASLYLNTRKTRQLRETTSASTMTRRRGDTSTSRPPSRFPGPAAGRCDQLLSARTRPRRKPQTERSSRNDRRSRHPLLGRTPTPPNKTLRPCPLAKTPTALGRTPATSEQNLAALPFGDLINGMVRAPKDRCRAASSQ